MYYPPRFRHPAHFDIRVGGAAQLAGRAGDGAQLAGRVGGAAQLAGRVGRVGRVGGGAQLAGRVGRVGGGAQLTGRVGRVGGAACVGWVGGAARVGRVGGGAQMAGRVGRVGRVGGRVGGGANVKKVINSTSQHVVVGAYSDKTGKRVADLMVLYPGQEGKLTSYAPEQYGFWPLTGFRSVTVYWCPVPSPSTFFGGQFPSYNTHRWPDLNKTPFVASRRFGNYKSMAIPSPTVEEDITIVSAVSKPNCTCDSIFTTDYATSLETAPQQCWAREAGAAGAPQFRRSYRYYGYSPVWRFDYNDDIPASTPTIMPMRVAGAHSWRSERKHWVKVFQNWVERVQDAKTQAQAVEMVRTLSRRANAAARDIEQAPQ